MCIRDRRTVDGPLFRCVYIALFVDRLTEHVEHASKGRFTDRCFNRVTVGQHLVAAADALTWGEYDAAHGVAADVLCDLHHARLSVRCNGKRFIYLKMCIRDRLDTVCLCGTAPGKTLAVTAGVHVCEYVGVQALRRLAAELDPAELSGNVIFLPLANPTGFYAGAKQVVPEDGDNLNRAFPGDPAGTLSARLAHALEAALYPVADFLADLHSGDCNEALYPLVFFPMAGTETVNQAACAAARTLTVP